MSFQGIAAKVGKSWKDLDPKLKQGYDERAKQDKLRFKREKVRDSVDLLFYFHPLDVRGSSVASLVCRRCILKRGSCIASTARLHKFLRDVCDSANSG